MSERKDESLVDAKTLAKQQSLQGFGGWLWLYVLLLALGVIDTFFRSSQWVVVRLNENGGSYTVPFILLYAAASIVSIAFLVYLLLAIVGVKPNAIALVKMFLAFNIILNLLGLLRYWVTGEGRILFLVLSMLVHAVWLLYFFYSRRVTATFPLALRTVYLRDKVFFGVTAGLHLAVWLSLTAPWH